MFVGSGATWNYDLKKWDNGQNNEGVQPGATLACIDDPRVSIMINENYAKPQLVIPKERMNEFSSYADQGFDIVYYEDQQSLWSSPSAMADFNL